MSIDFARRCFLITLFLVVLSRIATAADDDRGSEDLVAKVDRLFETCNRPDVPGCTVGIIRDGQLIYRKGFGTANLNYAVPNTPRTIFDIGSAAKGFTSACIALLMDEGKLDPDDDVRRLIPELKGLDHPVRIRHMLRCESGLWEQFHIMPLAGWDNVPNHVGYSKADLFTVLTGQKRLPFEPGTEFQYGSGDFFLLGIVVERVTGQSLARFARERLFQPLGMTHTYYEVDPGIAVKNRAVGHWKEDEGWSSQGPKGEGPWRLWQANGYVAGPAGVCTCVDDLYRWDLGFDSDVLPRGKYMTEFLTEGTVLGNRFVVDADAYRKRVYSHPENPPPGRYRGLRRIQFTGGFWGMTSCVSRFPDEKFTVICLSNSGEVSPFAKTREIVDLFLADKLAPIAPPASDEEQSFVSLTPDQLQKLTGTFRDAGNAPVWRTEVRQGELMLIDHLEKAFVLKPLSASRFKPVGKTPFYPSARFEFAIDDAGTAKGLGLSSCESGFHETYRFNRVQLVEPSAEKLGEYAGQYISPELAATYRFKVEDGGLWLRVNSRRWERLRALVRDEFTPDRRDPHDQRFFRFSRDSDGKIIGLSAGMWRVRGVSFAKVPGA
jgi:CubicO group peptidase (beta-lactamase class C family)